MIGRTEILITLHLLVSLGIVVAAHFIRYTKKRLIALVSVEVAATILVFLLI